MIKKIMMAGAVLLLSAAYIFSEPLNVDQKQQLNITQNSQKIRKKGGLPLYFADAETGNPVRNARVSIKGEVGSYITDKNGFITLPELGDGDYSFSVSAPDYISESFDFSVKSGFIPNYRFVLSRTLASKEYRIVLTWGDQPADLDLHLEKDNGFHVSYRNMTESADGSVRLDRDDRNSFGPETITIKGMKEDANYFVYVVDFTNREKSESSALASSGAFVKLYYENSVLDYFWVPEEKNGNRWNICTIQNGRILYENNIISVQ
ncbi:MAG: carboxypeptidase regulatory-like domain-containing protein [Treponema sp.]|nr:carboxypeptidase regulatory-like domain-containing protein [Treponema sp.]